MRHVFVFVPFNPDQCGHVRRCDRAGKPGDIHDEDQDRDAAERVLRELLWAGHHTAGDGHVLYGDDGELQCCSPDGAMDFMRGTAAQIKEHIERRGLRLLQKASTPSEPDVVDGVGSGDEPRGIPSASRSIGHPPSTVDDVRP